MEQRIIEIRAAVEVFPVATSFEMHAVAASRTGERLLPTRLRHRVRTVSDSKVSMLARIIWLMLSSDP